MNNFVPEAVVAVYEEIILNGLGEARTLYRKELCGTIRTEAGGRRLWHAVEVIAETPYFSKYIDTVSLGPCNCGVAPDRSRLAIREPVDHCVAGPPFFLALMNRVCCRQVCHP